MHPQHMRRLIQNPTLVNNKLINNASFAPSTGLALPPAGVAALRASCSPFKDLPLPLGRSHTETSSRMIDQCRCSARWHVQCSDEPIIALGATVLQSSISHFAGLDIVSTYKSRIKPRLTSIEQVNKHQKCKVNGG